MIMEDIQKSRAELPICKAKMELLKVIYHNKTIVLVGETACGKTTQIPQYLLDGGFAKNKCIGITQPRRVAAVTIATRVAKEVRTELGGKVGYSVRFEDVTSSATKIKYLTDGMLLRESISDAKLSKYSVIILDEAHERTLCNDILSGIVKTAQKLRSSNQSGLLPLKIIVMSATLDYHRFAEYFEAPAYFVKGREFSIKILNSVNTQEDYQHSALITVFQIHQNEDDGDILVFCTGQEEIDSLAAETENLALHLPAGCKKLSVWKLYAALPSALQNACFDKAPAGYRKVIYSTNIAETSVTISGIKFVVDTGMVKVKSYNPQCGFDVLKVQRISKAQAEQRAGRAGRESDGMCYRLYTLDEHKMFQDQSVPEILRCCLSNAILQMVAVGIHNICEFDFIDKPSEDHISASIEQLKLLEAVNRIKWETIGSLELTECGNKMVKFPLDPVFSKMIITSSAYRCTDEILTIISLLSVESIFYTSSEKREQFSEVRKKFETSDGDHIMLLNVYKAFRNVKENPAWCKENFVNSRNMKKALRIRKQLSEICEKIGIKPCSSGGDTLRIKKCLTSGLFMNAAVFHKKGIFKVVHTSQVIPWSSGHTEDEILEK
ncbi:ATP-dependent RNA helicase DHX33-like isoform X2 [Uloborus diversus]|uniref:ATP-dependent RNA helicase DHX33-like isoform X2 n=1 Tax=Uloborus diversus TaxID=327109 RepID=UPI002409EA98|nr:ATP-dependent RNA helicase DHX33-like isoform X2 [Uloborus diversus]